MFDAIDNLHLLLPAFTGMIATLTFHTDRLESLAPQGFSLATDIAEWLVRERVPFRIAHEVAGECVRVCEKRGIELTDLSDADLAAISEHLTKLIDAYMNTCQKFVHPPDDFFQSTPKSQWFFVHPEKRASSIPFLIAIITEVLVLLSNVLAKSEKVIMFSVLPSRK